MGRFISWTLLLAAGAAFTTSVASAQTCVPNNPVLQAPTTLEVNQTGTFNYGPGTNVIWSFPPENVHLGSPVQLSFNQIGTLTYNVSAKNNCGTTVTQTANLTIIPAMAGLGISINNGAANTTSANVTLALTAQNASQMYITNDSTCSSGGTWQPFAKTLPWTLANESKAASVFVKFQDAANTSACLSASIMFDKTPPVIGFVTMPPSISNSSAASFTFFANDAISGVKTFECALDQAPMQVCPLNVNLTGLPPGSHSMSIQATDNLGNMSAAQSYTWLYSPPPPPSNPTLKINDGATLTRTAAVTLTLSATDAADMYVTNDSTCVKGGTWQPYSTTLPWTLASENAHASVYAEFRNAYGVSACVEASIMFDMTAPTIAFVSVPDSVSYQSPANFVFSATDAISGVATFECALETESLHPCPLKYSIPGLLFGTHTMRIQAIDNAGNTSAMLTYTWQYRNPPPIVRITANPPATTDSADATFDFLAASGNGQVVTTCDLDGSGFADCTSPVSYSSLTVGSHTFQVVATDSFGQASAPASYTWQVVAAPPPPPPPQQLPVAYIDNGPDHTTPLSQATFEFHGTSATSTIASYSCSLDSQLAQPCTSPKSYTGLKPGPHEFSLVAIDATGLASQPATYSWQQTDSHTPIVDDFVVDSSGNKIDIVIVDDNSPSMDEEQDKMAKRFSHFLEHLKGLDWQLGIVTTDAHNGSQNWKAGRLVPFKGLQDTHIINANTPNVETVFANTVRRPEWGSDDEQGIRALYRMFNRPENRPMVRDHSLVTSIVVSDEDERSNEYDLHKDDMPENLLSYFDKTYGTTNTYINHSIISTEDEGDPVHDPNGPNKNPRLNNNRDKSGDDDGGSFHDNPNCPQVGDHYYGRLYAKLSQMTGGVVGDICAPDYGQILANIGDSLRNASFTAMLKCAPVNGKVSLKLTPDDPAGFTYTTDGKKLSIAPYPPIGTKIEATYYCD